MKNKEFKDFLDFVLRKTLPLCENDDKVVSEACIKINKEAYKLCKRIEREPRSDS